MLAVVEGPLGWLSGLAGLTGSRLTGKLFHLTRCEVGCVLQGKKVLA